MWNRIEDVPPRLQRIGGVELTLEQANMIAGWADELAGDDTVRNPWGVAVARFRRTHEIAGDGWHEIEAGSAADQVFRAGFKFAKKIFRSAAEAEDWLEENTGFEVDSSNCVQDMGDAYYYMIGGVDTTVEKLLEEAGNGLGVSELFRPLEKKEPTEMKQEEKVLETFDIDEVEIFRTGVWTDSEGREIEYTKEDLQAMADAYAELKGSFEAPVKLGHDESQALLITDGLPAAGWLANLRVKGESLVADLKDVPRKVYELIKSNGYKKRSLEVIHNFRGEAGKVYRHVAAGLALLGANLPAIGSLSEMKNLYSSVADPEKYYYEAEGKSIETVPESGGETTDAPEEAADKTKEENELLARISELEAIVETLEKRLLAFEEKVEAVEEVVDSEDGEDKEKESAEVNTGAVAQSYARAQAFLRKHAKSIPPSFHSMLERVMVLLDTHGATEAGSSKYGYCGGDTDMFLEFVSSYTEHSAMREYGRNLKRGGETESDTDIEKYCSDNGLDPANAADYARAVISTTSYVTPLPLGAGRD